MLHSWSDSTKTISKSRPLLCRNERTGPLGVAPVLLDKPMLFVDKIYPRLCILNLATIAAHSVFRWLCSMTKVQYVILSTNFVQISTELRCDLRKKRLHGLLASFQTR